MNKKIIALFICAMTLGSCAKKQIKLNPGELILHKGKKLEKKFVDKRIEKLELSSINLTDIDGLENLIYLKELSLRDNNLTKIEGLNKLKKLEKPVVLSVVQAVEALADDPFPPGSCKLAGSQHTYRIRIGNYRVIYSIKSSVLIIEIIKVGHRKDIYRRLN